MTAVIQLLGGTRAAVFALLALLGWASAGYQRLAHDALLIEAAQTKAKTAVEAERAATALADAQAEIRTREQQHAESIAAIATQYQEEIRNAKLDEDRTVGALRADNLRVRRELRATACDSGPGTGAAATPGRGDGSETACLSRNDQEVLLRLGARADADVRQLTACQAVIRQYRESQ